MVACWGLAGVHSLMEKNRGWCRAWPPPRWGRRRKKRGAEPGKQDRDRGSAANKLATVWPPGEFSPLAPRCEAGQLGDQVPLEFLVCSSPFLKFSEFRGGGYLRSRIRN